MRIGNLDGRTVLVRPAPDGAATVGVAEVGAPFAEPAQVFADLAAFRAHVTAAGEPAYRDVPVTLLGPPVPRPGQVFGVGLNYHDHLAEIGRAGTRPLPMTFTKFPSSVTGPFADVEIPTASVDYEIELVAVIGTDADRVPAGEGWSHVGGLTVGQDLSARGVQQAQQLSLSKSFRGFAPTGPWVVTPEDVPDRDDLEIVCTLNGEIVQRGRTTDMVHGVGDLVEFLSTVTPLRAGDLVFTGTCAGVGFFRSPQRFLVPGDLVVSEIPGIGRMTNRCVPSTPGGVYDEAFAGLRVGPSQMAARR